jgi:hypothetical protein
MKRLPRKYSSVLRRYLTADMIKQVAKRKKKSVRLVQMILKGDRPDRHEIISALAEKAEAAKKHDDATRQRISEID